MSFLGGGFSERTGAWDSDWEDLIGMEKAPSSWQPG